MKRHSCTTLPESRSMATRRGSLPSVSLTAIRTRCGHGCEDTHFLLSMARYTHTRLLVLQLEQAGEAPSHCECKHSAQYTSVGQTHFDLAFPTGITGKRSIASLRGVLLRHCPHGSCRGSPWPQALGRKSSKQQVASGTEAATAAHHDQSPPIPSASASAPGARLYPTLIHLSAGRTRRSRPSTGHPRSPHSPHPTVPALSWSRGRSHWSFRPRTWSLPSDVTITEPRALATAFILRQPPH